MGLLFILLLCDLNILNCSGLKFVSLLWFVYGTGSYSLASIVYIRLGHYWGMRAVVRVVVQ